MECIADQTPVVQHRVQAVGLRGAAQEDVFHGIATKCRQIRTQGQTYVGITHHPFCGSPEPFLDLVACAVFRLGQCVGGIFKFRVDRFVIDPGADHGRMHQPQQFF